MSIHPTPKVWDIPGGIHPAENKTQSLQRPITQLPLPKELVLPLNQHIGSPAKPVVAVGDKVLKGDKIAEAQGFVSAPVHAPTSGTVSAIEDRLVPHPSGMTARCIVITPDGKDQWCQHQGLADHTRATASELLDIIREAGITGLGGAGFPSAVKLAPRQTIDTLIINGTECEPYITADDILMQARAEDIIKGTKILSFILGNPDNLLIGIEDNKPKAFEILTQAAAGTGITVVEFPTKYPSGGEKQLIQILTGREVPSGKLPADLGIVCQNVGTTYAIFRAVCHGEPLLSRITTVTGNACSTNGNYEVLIGTPVSHLLDHNGYEQENCPNLIMGGPMMGFALPDSSVPLVKTSNCIIAPSHEEMPGQPPVQPCIRCGICAEACPASLLPQQLLWYTQSHNHDRLEAHNLFDCIECGACAYVCPSNIPLVQYYRAAKGEIRDLAAEKRKSDHARQRFEFHKARLEKAEADKAAKREARREAALKAQENSARQSAESTPGEPQQAGGMDDLIQAAMARAAARKASPEQQQAKLERGLEAAKNRLSVAEGKLQEAIGSNAGDEQRDKLQVKVDEARLKLTDAERKLAEFSVETNPSDLAYQAEKIVTKIQTSPRHQAEENIATLHKKIATTEQKIAQADNAETRAALEKGLEKLQQKLADAQQALGSLAEDADKAVDDPPALDAAAAAIARAQAKAQAQATMSPQQKLDAALASLQARIEKSRHKLALAESEQSEHSDTLRAALEKLEAKYAATESERQQLAQQGETE